MVIAAATAEAAALLVSLSLVVLVLAVLWYCSNRGKSSCRPGRSCGDSDKSSGSGQRTRSSSSSDRVKYSPRVVFVVLAMFVVDVVVVDTAATAVAYYQR